MKVIFTKHANLKFAIYKRHKINIKHEYIRSAFKKIQISNFDQDEVYKTIREIDEKHSIVVIYKIVGEKIVVITFWPTKKGRYESKIQ